MKAANGVIYARYSSHNQKETSIEDQVRVCEEYAKRHDINIIKVYPDKATSGRTDKRRHFQDMIEDSYYGNFQYVITYKLDRFARNRIDSAKYRSILKSNGVKLLSAMENLSDDPSSIILEGVLEAMAEHYSANLSQNIRRGMDSNAEKCLCTGGNRTLGYQVIDKKFHLDPVTAPIVRNIFEMYAKGHTQAEILRYLNSKHLKTAYGNEFGKNSVAYILKNKRYAGYYTYNGTEKKGGIPAIVSEELFDTCQKLMAKNKKAPAKTKAKNGMYLLSGSMVCGYCGRNVTGISGTSKSGGKTHYYYSCASHSGKCKCELKNRRRADLEDFVIAHTLKILTPERIEYIAKKVVALCEKERNDKSEITALEKELRKVKKEARNLLTAIKAGKAKQILLDELEQLEEQQQEIERRIERERIRIPALTVDKVKFFMERFAGGDIKDPYFQEKLINTFVNKIELYNDKIAITYNIGDGYLHDKHISICICPYLVEVNGYELMEYIRPLEIPVIFITAKGSVEERVKGLRLGADDYLVKPFEIVELLARVESVLRRYHKYDEHIVLGDIEVDTRSRTVRKNGSPVNLTMKEYELLLLFVQNKNIALFRETIYERIWESDFLGDSRTVDLHVQRLRKKLGLEDKIVAVYKVGYRLEI